MGQFGWRQATMVGWMLGALTACSAITDPGAPATSFDPNNDIKELAEQYGSKTSISVYYSKAKSGETLVETKTARDDFVIGRMTLINLQYIQFIRQFAASAAQLEAAFDITKLGVGLATTLVPAASTKSILGAISAGLTGTKTSIEKNFFQEKTVPVLISEMNAQRKTAVLPILAGLTQDAKEYPLSTALVDLQNYYEAGTFVGALQSIQKSAGVKEAAADENLEIYRSVVFAADANTALIKAYIWPSGTNKPQNAENVRSLRAWMAANKSLPQGLPIATFLNDAAFASQRKQAVEQLNIN